MCVGVQCVNVHVCLCLFESALLYMFCRKVCSVLCIYSSTVIGIYNNSFLRAFDQGDPLRCVCYPYLHWSTTVQQVNSQQSALCVSYTSSQPCKSIANPALAIGAGTMWNTL